MCEQGVEGIDPGYDRYERFIVETPTAKVINAAMSYAGMSTERLRKVAGQPLQTCFDLIAATSTSSIIAGAAATGIPMEKIVQHFEEEAPRICRKICFRHP